MAERIEPRIDRLLAGDLSPADERSLAQASLDDPDVFDELMAAGAARSALDAERGPRASTVESPKPASGPVRRWSRFAMSSALAAAATVALAIGYAGWARRAVPALPAATGTASPPAALPAPLLLTASRHVTPDGQTFRSDDSASRLPKPAGTVVSVHDGLVEIDLGSLDGLRQDEQVAVFRGSGGADAGRLRITTVFRERSRGRPIAGAPRPGDRVETGASVHTRALLAQATARQSAGDASTALTLFDRAASAARAADVPADVRRQALEQLGRLRHQARDLDDAARLLSEAVEEFEMEPAASSAERAEVLNELGSVQIEQRNLAAAGQTLRAAESYATGASKVRVANNLGALAALRGDRAAADASYQLAYALATDAPELAAERAAIERNLNALRAGR